MTESQQKAPRDWMLDLETLGTGPNAKILSIGALIFDPTGRTIPTTNDETSSFYGVIDAASYGSEDDDNNGAFTEDPATRAWWDKQSDAVRAEVMDNPQAKPWRTVLSDLLGWLERSFDNTWPPYVWANSPAFDCVILTHAFKQAFPQKPVPWKYFNQRDVRSLGALCGARFSTFRQLWEGRCMDGVAHHALTDCRFQARFVQHCNRILSHPNAPTSQAVVLYTGPMYSGKTDALIAHLQYAQAAANKYETSPIVVKHANDSVRHGAKLESRTGAVWEGGEVHSLTSLETLFTPPIVQQLGTTVVLAIDEAQFFDTAQLAKVVQSCVARGTRVVLSGLSAVADASPWPSMAAVLPYVTRTVHLRADCSVCGARDLATLTHRQTDPESTFVSLPASQVCVSSLTEEEKMYQPVCVECYCTLVGK